MSASILCYAREYKERKKTLNYLMPAENLVRAVKVCKLGIPLVQENKLLDFGCGDGRHTEYFLDLGYKVLSTDCSNEAIDATKYRLLNSKNEKHLITKLITDLNDIEGCDKNINLIVAWEVLHWLGNSEKWRKFFIIASKKLIAQNGSIIFTMPTEEHYLLSSAKKIDQDTYLATVKSRLDCQLYAPL